MAMLSVAGMARSRVFYETVLGGTRAYQFPPDGEPGFLALLFGDTELGLGLMTDNPLHGRPLRPATGHRVELCIFVDDCDEAVAALSAIGAPVVMPPTDLPWGERSAYVEDPDGNLVMLAAAGSRPG
jgi:lactoylglutathione lyase